MLVYLFTISTKPTTSTLPTKSTMLTTSATATMQTRRQVAFLGHAPPNHRLCPQARNVPPKLGLRSKKSVGFSAVGWHFEAVPYQIAACASQK